LLFVSDCILAFSFLDSPLNMACRQQSKARYTLILYLTSCINVINEQSFENTRYWYIYVIYKK
jgi:hypothetical protein